jgi:glycine cleavage system aminomethyltransferase T
MAAGQPYNIVPSPPNTIRSVEGGLLSYVSDISLADNAFVLGIDWLVDLDQTDDFIGKAALAKIKTDGPERLLVGVELHGSPLEAPNSEFWPVHSGDEKIGHVTRCVFSPRLKRNIGFANVPVAAAKIGSELTIKAPLGDRKASVCEFPWFRAQKKMRAEFWEVTQA